MKYFIHPLNPHVSATFADDFRDGWRFGIWPHPYPAPEPFHYEFQSRNLEAAQHSKLQAEEATRHLADMSVKGPWLELAAGIDAHSESAARDLLARTGTSPVRWPWTEAPAAAVPA